MIGWTSLQKRKEELLWKCKESRREFQEKFFGIPESSDTGRPLENLLGKFRECGPWFSVLSCKATLRLWWCKVTGRASNLSNVLFQQFRTSFYRQAGWMKIRSSNNSSCSSTSHWFGWNLRSFSFVTSSSPFFPFSQSPREERLRSVGHSLMTSGHNRLVVCIWRLLASFVQSGYGQINNRPQFIRLLFGCLCHWSSICN